MRRKNYARCPLALRFTHIVIVVLMLLCSLGYSEGARVAVMSATLTNTDAALSWLGEVVTNRIAQNIRAYFFDYTLVDITNESAIKKLQAKSDGDFFDSDTAIEVGKLVSANCAVFPKITKAKGYTLSITFSDLTTGLARAKVISNAVNDEEKLYSSAGCVIDQLTIDIASQLGVNLLPSQVYRLQYGDHELTSDERLEQAKRDEDEYNKRIKELNDTIAKLSNDTDPDSSSQVAKLQAKRALEEERLRQSLEMAKTLQEAEDKKRAYDERDAERANETKAQREKLAAQLQEKTQKLRALKLQGMDVFTQLSVLESKKRALSDINKTVEEQVDQITAAAQNQIDETAKQIMDAPYRRAEITGSGEPTAKAYSMRAAKVDKATAEINSKCSLDIANLRASVQKQKSDLLAEIDSDTKALEAPRTVRSDTPNVKLSFGPYDGESLKWTLNVFVYSGDSAIFSHSMSISYNDMRRANKKLPDPNTSDKKSYEKYLTTIDLYDSLFARGESVISAKVTYNVKVRERVGSSDYLFTLTNITLLDTMTGVVIKNSTSNEIAEFNTPHEDDLRSDSEKEADIAQLFRDNKQHQAQEEARYKEIRQEERRQEAQHKKDAKKERARYNKNQDSWAYHTLGGGGRSGVMAGFGFTSGTQYGFAFNGEVMLAILSHFYLDVTLGAKPTPSRGYSNLDPDIAWSGYCFTNTYGFGINERVHLGRFHPNLFATIGLGYDLTGGDWGGSSSDSSNSTSSSSSGKSDWNEYHSDFLMRLSCGVDIPFTQYMGLNFTYALDYKMDVGFCDVYTFGVIITFPRANMFKI